MPNERYSEEYETCDRVNNAVTNSEHGIQAGKFEWFYRQAKPVGEPRAVVVLLHGLVCQSYGWRNVLPALAQHGFWAIG
ncbi:MAG: hypothetical protein IGS48_06675 [Oscillatoriales cyanobacterium C42_A2020_001]|nr:hypothetical protein [Leptolyngbyaceae cyanobacterium C42_A2020_001]